MLRKFTLGLMAAALLALPSLSVPVFAADWPIELNNGKLKDNRLLIPLREVAQNMGAFNSIIQNKGLEFDYVFQAPLTTGSYRFKTTGSFLQSLDIGHDAWETKYMMRNTKIIKVNGVWKADSVSFTEGKNPISGA